MDSDIQATLNFVNHEIRSMSIQDALEFVEELIGELKVTAEALERDLEDEDDGG